MIIPLTVPNNAHEAFKKNYEKITHKTNRLFLFAGDQKIEHLNADFYGEKIPDVCNNPEHLFTIASKANIGCFAAHLGLIARYGQAHKTIPYVVKLNGKTNLPSSEPISKTLYSIADVVAFSKRSGLHIAGVGYTVYLGSEHESSMLAAAAQHVLQAHQHGLVAILWVYPRGAAVTDPSSPDMIAGAAGVAASLGADFVKIAPPATESPAEQAQALRQAVGAAGNTGVLCAGGTAIKPETFLTCVQAQLSIAGARGVAVGRNVYQRSVEEAVDLCQQISDLVYK